MPASTPQYDTLIMSDLHLGAAMSRAREALDILQQTSYRRLILLGDIFADLNFGRLKKEHWKFLGYIRKLSNPKRQVEVVWVEGNHDHGLAEIMSHLVGVKVYQEYRWEYQGQQHIAIHGHQFDNFSVSNVRLSYWVGTLLYMQLQKLDSKNKVLTRFLDRLNTRWLRLSSKVAAGALAHAQHNKAARIFCGHTHASMHKQEAGAEYFNCGAWIDERPTYITVAEDGVRIHEYAERAGANHSRDDHAEPDRAEEVDAEENSETAGARNICASRHDAGADEFPTNDFFEGETEDENVEDGEYESIGG